MSDSLQAQLALIATRIVHRDATLIAVDKPPGFVSAGPSRMGRESIESLLVRALGRRVWTVHQLDRDTSGLNLFVLTRAAVAVWVERMKVEGPKRYLAVTHGVPALAPGARIEAAMAERPHPVNGKLFPAVVPADAPDAKASVTELVRVIPSASGDNALVEVRPLTGRTHQVRVHLAHIGCPLVGEQVHHLMAGAPTSAASHPRHALHAWRLTFVGLPLEAPLAPDLQALCERLGIVTGL